MARRSLPNWCETLSRDYDTLHRAAEQLDIEVLNTADVTALSRSNLVHVWTAAVAAHNRIEVAVGGLRAIIAAAGVPSRREHAPSC